RLVERFNQLRQNLGPGLARARRQLSESIVNTPLPPVPALDKRSQSTQQNDSYYEDAHLYNKPIYSLEDQSDTSVMSTSAPAGDAREAREVRCIEDAMAKSAPPLPLRPKSGDPRSPTRPAEHNRDSIDGEVETRRHSRASWSEPGDAPPLPPRVSGDKRSWSEAPPAVPRRACRADAAERRCDDARDSGVSVDNAYTNAGSTRSHRDKRSWSEAPPAVPRRACRADAAERRCDDARDSGVSVDNAYTNAGSTRSHRDKRSWSEAPPAVPRRACRADAAERRCDDARDSGVSVDNAYTNAGSTRSHRECPAVVNVADVANVADVISGPGRRRRRRCRGGRVARTRPSGAATTRATPASASTTPTPTPAPRARTVSVPPWSTWPTWPTWLTYPGDKRSWSEAPPAVPRRACRADAAERRCDDARDSGVSVDNAYTNAGSTRSHRECPAVVNVADVANVADVSR
ncbi:hypothetical protein ACJJTC_014403, partial [Scirpophaga incertulas]